METTAEVAAEAFAAEAGVAPTVVDAGVDAPTVTASNTTSRQFKDSDANSKFYTEDDLAKVRSQEKDKLYPQIEKLKSELEEIKKAREAELSGGKSILRTRVEAASTKIRLLDRDDLKGDRRIRFE